MQSREERYGSEGKVCPWRVARLKWRGQREARQRQIVRLSCGIMQRQCNAVQASAMSCKGNADAVRGGGRNAEPTPPAPEW